MGLQLAERRAGARSRSPPPARRLAVRCAEEAPPFAAVRRGVRRRDQRSLRCLRRCACRDSTSRESAKLGFLLGLVVSLLVSSIVVGGPIVSMPGPVDIEGTRSRRQFWPVPSTDPSVPIRTTVFRPPGEGPFLLVVMYHGTTQNTVQRQQFPSWNSMRQPCGLSNRASWWPRRSVPVHGETGGRTLLF